MAGENIESTTRSLIMQREDGEEKHGRPKEPWKGEYVKSIVYAGLDAIINCFSLISSISASRSSYVLVLGFANLVADGISMGLGDYISSRTRKAVVAKERAITEWDVKNHRGPQQLELIRQYQALGMDINDATTIVEILAKSKDILVDEKMMAGKGTRHQDEAEKPWKNGLVTSASSIVFGSAPLLSSIILSPFTDSDSLKFIGACVLSGLALALLGMAKAQIAAQKYAFSVAFTLFNGAIAAAAAYTVSWTLKNVAGVEDRTTFNVKSRNVEKKLRLLYAFLDFLGTCFTFCFIHVDGHVQKPLGAVKCVVLLMNIGFKFWLRIWCPFQTLKWPNFHFLHLL